MFSTENDVLVPEYQIQTDNQQDIRDVVWVNDSELLIGYLQGGIQKINLNDLTDDNLALPLVFSSPKIVSKPTPVQIEENTNTSISPEFIIDACSTSSVSTGGFIDCAFSDDQQYLACMYSDEIRVYKSEDMNGEWIYQNSIKGEFYSAINWKPESHEVTALLDTGVLKINVDTDVENIFLTEYSYDGFDWSENGKYLYLGSGNNFLTGAYSFFTAWDDENQEVVDTEVSLLRGNEIIKSYSNQNCAIAGGLGLNGLWKVCNSSWYLIDFPIGNLIDIEYLPGTSRFAFADKGNNLTISDYTFKVISEFQLLGHINSLLSVSDKILVVSINPIQDSLNLENPQIALFLLDEDEISFQKIISLNVGINQIHDMEISNDYIITTLENGEIYAFPIKKFFEILK